MANGVVLLIIVAFSMTAGSACAGEDTRLSIWHDKDHPVDFSPKYSNRAAWEKRAAFLRRQVLVSQGLWPMPAKAPLNAVIHGIIEREGYTVEKVFFASLPGNYVSGNLYRPTG